MPLLLPALALPLLVLLSALVLLGLNNTTGTWLRSIFEGGRAHGVFGTVLSIASRPAVALVRAAEGAVKDAISRWAAAHLAPVTRWFVSLNTLIRFTYTTLGEQAVATTAAVATLLHVTIPRETRAAVRPVRALARTAQARANVARAVAAATASSLANYRARTDPRLRSVEHQTTAVLPRDIGRIRAREGQLDKDLAKLRERTKGLEGGALKTFEWLRSHPLSGTTAVFAGAVAVALAHLGFGFLRCKNWRSLGRRITCGMGAWLHGLLDLIAVFALALLGVLNPEVLAAVSVRAVDVIEPELEKLLAAVPSAAQIEKDIARFESFLGIG